MKIVLDNLILSAAIFVSVLFHTIVLMVHFVMPKAEPVPAEDPGRRLPAGTGQARHSVPTGV